MNDPARLRIDEPSGGADEQLCDALPGQAAFLRDELFKALVVHVLHGEEVRAAGLADVVDRHDVGVVQGSSGLGLAVELPHELRVSCELGREDLERDVAVEAILPGPEDCAHAAAPEGLLDGVAWNL